MITIIGVNEISILLQEELKGSFILGPYKEKVNEKHINEGINPLSIISNTKNSTTIIDTTFNTITSLIINDIALKYNKSLISTVIINQSLLVKNVSKGSCVRCEVENNIITSNFIVVTNLIKDKKLLVEAIIESLNTRKSFLIEGEKKESMPIKTQGCGSCLNQEYRFLEGDYGEMINENCGNKSAGVFPIDDREIDLNYISKNLKLQNITIIEENENYISFLAEDKKFFLFKNGRLMISEIETKEETEYFYRKYIGN